jgi:signal transduction histidine kinase
MAQKLPGNGHSQRIRKAEPPGAIAAFTRGDPLRVPAMPIGQSRAKKPLRQNREELLALVAELSRQKDQLALVQTISLEVAASHDLSEAMQVVLRRVCEMTGWDVGEVWFPDAEGSALTLGPWWLQVHNPAIEEFRRASSRTRFVLGVGLPGRVWASKQPAWVQDVTSDSNFPRRDFAVAAGLKAALAIPIVADDNVLAVMEFFVREMHRRDEQLVKSMAAVAAQLNMAIERKRAEDALREANQKLAHASRLTMTGELTASIAHEISQPLAAISLMARACDQWLTGPAASLEEAKECLAEISAGAERVREVINRIRTLTKKARVDSVPLQINDVIEQALSLARHELVARQTTVRADLAQPLPIVVGDRIQLQQGLLNLILNAVQAMDSMPAEMRRLVVQSGANGDRVVVEVQDSGPGLPPEVRTRLFTPFFTTKEEGLGLGLSITRSIVEAHGGRIAAVSSTGGATFRVELPAAEAMAV